VITKEDLKEKRHELQLLLDNFKQIGVAEPYFITSSYTKTGIEELKKYLSSL
jgi:ethanolamine utilization protein EutP (predicted NTPase)